MAKIKKEETQEYKEQAKELTEGSKIEDLNIEKKNQQQEAPQETIVTISGMTRLEYDALIVDMLSEILGRLRQAQEGEKDE